MNKIKDILIVFSFQAITMLLSIFFTPYFLSVFTSEEYGLIILTFQVIGFMSFLDLGIASFLTQKISAKITRPHFSEKGGRLIAISFVFFAAICLFLLPIIIIITYNFEAFFSLSFKLTFFSKTLIFIAFLSSFIIFLTKPFSSFLYSSDSFFYLNVVNNSPILIYNLLSFTLVKNGGGINSFFYGIIIGNLVSLLFALLFFRKRKELLRISMPIKKEISYFINGSFFLFLNGIAAQIIYNGDRIVVAKCISIATLTIFSVNIRIIEIAQTLLMKVSDIFIPKIIRIVSHNKMQAVHYYMSFTKLTVLTAAIIQANFLLFNSAFVKLWVGNSFILQDPYTVPLYLLVLFSNIVFRIPSLFLYALGKNRQYSLFSLIDALINLSLSIILARFFDIKGVVIATLIATCLTSVPSNLFFFKKAFNVEIRFYQCIQPVIIPFLLTLPVLAGCYLAAPMATSYIGNWLVFGVSVLLFNILLVSLVLIINYRKLSLFLKDFKFLNDGVYG